jgi:hypothetical protein
MADRVVTDAPSASPAASGSALLARASSTSAVSGPATVTWCGTGETPDNRLPQQDTLSPSAVRVLYAFPADVPDRLVELADAITSDVAAIDRWWRLQDPTRGVRFDTYAFAGCAPGIASLDLGVLALAHDAAYYAAPTGFERLANEIAPHLGETEKALVYLDGYTIDPGVCGVSRMAPRNGGRYGMSVVSLRSDCTVDLGTGLATARIATHELVHNLGAVPSRAPGRCGDSTLGGHTCDSPTDLMFPYAASDMVLPDAVLDVGHDDYYGHSGDWWDVQDSAWLMHLPFRRLTVAVTGRGSVSSAPSVVACPTSCSATLESDFTVRLVAVPDPGTEFYGWRGACAGSGACTTTMTADRSVTATFGLPRSTLTIHVVGRGRVVGTPSGIDCPGRCSTRYPRRATVTLRARPAAGWRLARWSSPCGERVTCPVQVTADRRVTATFVRR